MKYLHLILFSVFVYGSTLSVSANTSRDLKKAQQALSATEYDKAFQLYTRIEQASQHPLAQFSLALMYKQGLGHPVNVELACDWFKKAAEGDISTAAHEYAECLAKGLTGEPADFGKAAIWYQKAGDLGSYISYCALGRLFMSGSGVKTNPEKALELCQLPAEKGSPQAIIQLGRWRLEGEKNIRDANAALQWFKKGADLNVAEAEFYLAKMIRAKTVNGTTLLDARYWFEKAASKGYAPAYLPVGELYLTAQVEAETQLPSGRDLAKSYLWLSVAELCANQEQQLAATELLKKVIEIMPPGWKKDLDPKIAEHMAKYKPKKISWITVSSTSS